MSFTFPTDFEDKVTEYVVDFFKDLPADEFTEPKHLTNARLPMLAHELGSMARREGCLTHFSTPLIVDKWSEGRPAAYNIRVQFNGVKGRPTFHIPVLPRGAA